MRSGVFYFNSVLVNDHFFNALVMAVTKCEHIGACTVVLHIEVPAVMPAETFQFLSINQFTNGICKFYRIGITAWGIEVDIEFTAIGVRENVQRAPRDLICNSSKDGCKTGRTITAAIHVCYTNGIGPALCDRIGLRSGSRDQYGVQVPLIGGSG